LLGKRKRENAEDDEDLICLSTPPRLSSSFVGHGADEEDEVRIVILSISLLYTNSTLQIDHLAKSLETRTNAPIEVAAVLRSQISHRNALWMRSGGDTHQLVRDVCHYEMAGPTRDKT